MRFIIRLNDAEGTFYRHTWGPDHSTWERGKENATAYALDDLDLAAVLLYTLSNCRRGEALAVIRVA